MSLQNQSFSLTIPINIKYGLNVVQNELAKAIKSEKKEKVLIVSDKGLVKAGLIDQLTTTLNENGIQSTIYSDVEPNPTADSVMDGLKVYTEKGCEMIIAVGGGSAMDYAKALAVVATHPGHILEYTVGGKEITNNLPLIYAIPTTVGTGSEVTAVSVLTDSSAGRKIGVVSPYIVPNIAFIDPTLTYSLPRQHVAATGCDALVHAIESYTSIPANPITDGLALQAIRMIAYNLPQTYAHEDNIEARAQVHLASTIAGVAFWYSGLGIVHSCSHPMSARYHVPHGLANAILLPYVVEHNLISNVKKYAEIARIFEPKLVLEDDMNAAKKLVPILREFLNLLDIPKDFSYLGIDFTEEAIDQLAEDAMNDHGTVHFNPRKAYKEDIINIYKKVLKS